jgi:hypothetical protein
VNSGSVCLVFACLTCENSSETVCGVAC